MVNWRNTRIPKLTGEGKITSVYEMVINTTFELGFQFCSFTMSSQLPNNKGRWPNSTTTQTNGTRCTNKPISLK